MTTPYIGRLAPSPTGLLHLGHAATFLLAHNRARAANGRLLLRVDDLDAQRSREPFVHAAQQDLAWLGLTWDAELRQSQRLPLYRAALDCLLAQGLAYPCRCSRRDLQLAAATALAAPHEGDTPEAIPQATDDEPLYNGHCRPLEPVPSPFHAGLNYRFRIPDAAPVRFCDGHCGPQSFQPGPAPASGNPASPRADFGDFLLWRRDGLPSYQLACVVDDAATGITEVVRGRDLLKSTARQILLQRALGLATPLYFHTDLVRDRTGQRLAKRNAALSLQFLRASGVSALDLHKRLQQEAHHIG